MTFFLSQLIHQHLYTQIFMQKKVDTGQCLSMCIKAQIYTGLVGKKKNQKPHIYFTNIQMYIGIELKRGGEFILRFWMFH